jgi:hypothetical protein
LRQKLYLFLGLLASGILLYFLFRDIDSATFFSRIRSFWNEGRLWGLLFWSYLYVILQGVRYSMLYPGKASVWQHIGLNFGNHVGNILIPGRVGEVVRPLYLKRWWPETSLKEVIGWALFEKAGEFISMILFVVIGLLYFETSLSQHTPHANTMALAMGSQVLIFFALSLLRRWQKPLLSKKEKAFWTVLLSFLTWNANVLGVLSVTGDLKLSYALLVTMTLASAIPMLPAGLGAAQWAAVALGRFMDWAQNEAVIYSSTIHLLWIVVRLSVGLPLLLFVWGWPQMREINTVRQSPTQAPTL